MGRSSWQFCCGKSQAWVWCSILLFLFLFLEFLLLLTFSLVRRAVHTDWLLGAVLEYSFELACGSQGPPQKLTTVTNILLVNPKNMGKNINSFLKRGFFILSNSYVCSSNAQQCFFSLSHSFIQVHFVEKRKQVFKFPWSQQLFFLPVAVIIIVHLRVLLLKSPCSVQNETPFVCSVSVGEAGQLVRTGQIKRTEVETERK